MYLGLLHHDITEMLLRVALNTRTLTLVPDTKRPYIKYIFFINFINTYVYIISAVSLIFSLYVHKHISNYKLNIWFQSN